MRPGLSLTTGNNNRLLRELSTVLKCIFFKLIWNTNLQHKLTFVKETDLSGLL